MENTQGSQNFEEVSVIVFPGGFNLPLYIAEEEGFFASEGLKVTITPTPNSVFQMTSLIRGDFDVAMTAFDNVVAYNEGQTDSNERIEADIVAVSGGDGGFLSLVASGECDDVSALKGKRVAVDAMTTGYAFVLLEMLERNAVAREDVEFVKFGGVADRFRGLAEREFSATLLVTPFDIMAGKAGFEVLATASEVLGAYQGVVAAANRAWALENPQTLISFIRAQIQGVRWLSDAGNRDKAIQILRKYVPQMTAELAAHSCAAMLGSASGFQADAAIDKEGLRTVISLRQKYSGSRLLRADLESHTDLSYYAGAVAGISGFD